MSAMPRPTPLHDPDLTVVGHLLPAQLAARWSTSCGQLANLRWAGTGPAYLKIHSRVLYRVEDVQAYERASLIVPQNASA